MRTLVWFRGKDLRVSDHVPLRDAARAGDVIPLFILDPFFFDPKRARELPHRIQFLLDSLTALQGNLAHLGTQLQVVPGKSVDVLPRLVREWKVDRVVAHRWTEPFGRKRDAILRDALEVPFNLYEGETLAPPETIRTGSNAPFAVFTPFSRAFLRDTTIEPPIHAPRSLPGIPADVKTKTTTIPLCEDLGITPNPNILPGGEKAARKRLSTFLQHGVAEYPNDRNRMDRPGTSRMSVDLKFGTLSPRTIWHAVQNAASSNPPNSISIFLNEIIWREFGYATLWDRPDVLDRPFREGFEGFPWKNNESRWTAWTEGRTGYPVVDAGARQLLGEGFVHNRVRMIAASFLTKHLLIDYRRGEAHYMKFLTDGDWASNNMGWQWSTGCGCDAQPYFRVFNPVSQGERFDPDGDYVRRWVPELARMPTAHIHQPWGAPAHVLREADVVLGKTYPAPIVDHRSARETFLELAKKHLSKK